MKLPLYSNGNLSLYEMQMLVIRKVRLAMKWDKEKAETWLLTNNPLLGNVSPYDMIIMGRGQRLVDWIEQQTEDNNEERK